MKSFSIFFCLILVLIITILFFLQTSIALLRNCYFNSFLSHLLNCLIYLTSSLSFCDLTVLHFLVQTNYIILTHTLFNTYCYFFSFHFSSLIQFCFQATKRHNLPQFFHRLKKLNSLSLSLSIYLTLYHYYSFKSFFS